MQIKLEEPKQNACSAAEAASVNPNWPKMIEVQDCHNSNHD